MTQTVTDQLEEIREELSDLRQRFPKPQPKVYRPSEVAEILGISKQQVLFQCRKYEDSGGIEGWQHRRPSPRVIVFLPEDLDQLLGL